MQSFAVRTLLFWTVACVALASSFPGIASAQGSSVAPTFIPVSGRLVTAEGQPRTGAVSLVISLYDTQTDNAPRWIEQQNNVALDATGGYTVQFGATLPDGLPGDLFTAGAGTRWIGVAVQGEAEQPRVMLLSVPYAAKAASADTLAGRNANEFALASSLREDVRAVLEEEGVGGSGEVGVAATENFLQKGDNTGAVVDSTLVEVGGRLGIGTTNPTLGQLHIASTVGNSSMALQSADNGQAEFRIRRTSDNFGWSIYKPANSLDLRFWSGADRLTLSGGNIGIGTTSPTRSLDIAGANGSATDGRLRFSNAASSLYYREIGRNHATGAFEIVRAQGAAPVTDMVIDHWGQVGLGTGSPAARLHVVGAARITGDIVVDGNIAAKYQDVAEWVDSAEPLEAGSLVVIDTRATNRVMGARKAYDGRVAGAVSPQPGLILGEAGPGKVLVAQSGRVKVKADARNGAIRPGDLLVSSPTPGHVMRSRPVKMGDSYVHRPGTVVGKALEGLAKGKGEILVLLTLQ